MHLSIIAVCKYISCLEGESKHFNNSTNTEGCNFSSVAAGGAIGWKPLHIHTPIEARVELGKLNKLL